MEVGRIVAAAVSMGGGERLGQWVIGVQVVAAAKDGGART